MLIIFLNVDYKNFKYILSEKEFRWRLKGLGEILLSSWNFNELLQLLKYIDSSS